MKKVAIIYHYLALYRYPVFDELMKSTDIEYTLISGKNSEISIKKIDEVLAETPIASGGLRWRFVKNIWLFKNRLLWQSGLIGIILGDKYDSYVFLGSPYYISTWIAALLARIQKKRVYYWMHGIYKDKLSFVDVIKVKLFYKLANGYFLYGNRAANKIASNDPKSAADIHIVYNSLNYQECLKLRRCLTTNEIKQFRDEMFRDESVPIIVFIGRLNKIKRLELLIQSQKKLKDKYNTSFFNLILIGDGEQTEYLKILADEYNLIDDIKFAGSIYDESLIANYLMHSDLCVTPGEVGLTAIHSLSYGTPIISHNNLNVQMPEVEVIRPGVTGDLYDFGSDDDLIYKIERWLTLNVIKTPEIMQQCYEVIDSKYNPKYQAKIFNEVLGN